MSRRKLFSLRRNRSNPTKSLGYVAAHLSFDVSPLMKRSIRGGEKLEEVNYQQILTVAYAVLLFLARYLYMSILAWNLALILLCIVAHGGGGLKI